MAVKPRSGSLALGTASVQHLCPIRSVFDAIPNIVLRNQSIQIQPEIALAGTAASSSQKTKCIVLDARRAVQKGFVRFSDCNSALIKALRTADGRQQLCAQLLFGCVRRHLQRVEAGCRGWKPFCPPGKQL